MHDLITCKSKVQGVHWVLFALGRHWVLTNGTWHVLLQSGNVFELWGITIIYVFVFTELECTIWFSWPRIRSLVRHPLVSRTSLELFSGFQCPVSCWSTLLPRISKVFSVQYSLGSRRSSVSSAYSDVLGFQYSVSLDSSASRTYLTFTACSNLKLDSLWTTSLMVIARNCP